MRAGAVTPMFQRIERIEPASRAEWLELRKQDVTASVAACLLGDVHPYVTAFELWARKSGRLPEDASESRQMKRGRLLEPVAVELIREAFPPWSVRPNRDYFRAPAERIGATPDALATRPYIPGRGVVQIKTVNQRAFERDWLGADGALVVPTWVLVQASVEAFLTGATWATVAVMTIDMSGCLDLMIEDVPIVPDLGRRLIARVADFWRRVGSGDAYEPNYARDGDTLRAVWRDADDDFEIDLTGRAEIGAALGERELCQARERDGKQAAERRAQIDAQIIAALGNAATGFFEGKRISARTVRRKSYLVSDSVYRSVHVSDSSRPARATKPAI